MQARASDALLTELDSRDAAVWLLRPFTEAAGAVETTHILRLPWAFALSESSDAALVGTLEGPEERLDGPLVRRRGVVHVVDTNPSDVTLPPRSLPVFLLNGRLPGQGAGRAGMIRRQTMIQELERRPVGHLVILGGPDLILPTELADLWAEGFRSLLTVVSDDPEAEAKLEAWRAELGIPWVGLVSQAAADFASDLVQRYTESRDGRLILRLRDAKGTFHRLDVTGLDQPEHPILGRYELLTETHLLPLLPADLGADEVEGFFRDPRSSWRPFAAGMVWQRDQGARSTLQRALRRLDREGTVESRIFYVSAESGAGATTFVRDLAWSFAAEGYPVLLATQASFTPSGREVEAYMLRCLTAAAAAGIGENTQLYEVPWLIVFDRLQWEGREGEIVTFAREIEAAGRRVCIVVVTSALLPLAVYAERRLERLADLTHALNEADALNLGHHLNRYLRHLGTDRRDDEWRAFFSSSMVGSNHQTAAFWVVLSFWLQRQFDLTETVQGWLYRQFRAVTDPVLRQAIIDIAVMSTERQPLPEILLPPSTDFPTREKLSDIQSSFGALGIVRFRHEVQSFWALLHDQLGRFLLNGLFFDFAAREAAGFGEAMHPEHLRLLALRRIASEPALARNDLREVAEAFATTIFKIDPSQGRALFMPYWREALAALDAMPRAFRTTSRIFLHHAAVSRRRIAMGEDDFPISDDERAELLARATSDIEAALLIDPTPGEESDLNLLNSLAHAYHDLAEVEARRGASADRIAHLRDQARDATRRAYRLNPDNSYVLETYARDLLVGARLDPSVAPGNSVEVLGLVYGAMQRETAKPRLNALARLADTALDILLSVTAGPQQVEEPESEGEAIGAGLRALVDGVKRFEGMELKDYPKENRLRADEWLAHPLLRNNAQAIRLRYLLACLDRPTDFALQLELIEALEGSAGTFTPQMQLELAILLHQRDRHPEASRRFRALRALWSRGEHFVEVPERLRWLMRQDGQARRQVQARIGPGGEGGRHRAFVGELQNEEVPFRSRDFGQDQLRPGLVLRGLISFGHNGPFLRSLTEG